MGEPSDALGGDVSARSPTHATTRDVDSEYRTLFECAPDAQLVTTADGRIVEANDRATHLLGAPRDRLCDLALESLVPVDERGALRQHVARLVRREWRGTSEWDTTIRPLHREPFTARLRACLVDLPAADTQRLQWSLHDVTVERSAGSTVPTTSGEASRRASRPDDDARWRHTFMTAAAHDLRSPLAGVRAFAETLLEREGELTRDQRQAFLARIVQATNRMTRLIDDLLELDGATQGRITAYRVPTDLGRLVHDVVDDVDAREHRVEAQVDDAPVLEVDPLRIRQVVTNLLENALAHTPEGTTVRVRATGTPDGGGLLVVEDDGPGVPVEVADRMFQPFVSHPTTADAPGSHGLGLSLVRLFVELHGGIVAHQRPEGGGARFVVDLPRSD